MIGIQDKQCVFKYNAQDELIEYIEYDDDKHIKYAYHFVNNTLKKVYYNHEDDDSIYKELKSVTEFPPGCIMHHQIFDGMSRVVVRKPCGDYVAPLKRIEKHDGNFTGYSIKPELLNKWNK